MRILNKHIQKKKTTSTHYRFGHFAKSYYYVFNVRIWVNGRSTAAYLEAFHSFSSHN